MKKVAVLLTGMKHYEYFEIDEWQREDRAVVLYRHDAPGAVAAFPYENLLGIVDLSSKAPLSEGEMKEWMTETKKSSTGKTSVVPVTQ